MTVRLAPPVGGWHEPWPTVFEIAEILAPTPIVLVGGLMVQVHSRLANIGELGSRLAAVHEATGESMDAIVEAEMAAGESGAGVDLSNMLLGRTDRIPDRERLGAAIRMLRAVVAHAPDELRPGPLTMLGWCLWAIGSAAAAGAMLDWAVKLAPEYRMAAFASHLGGCGDASRLVVQPAGVTRVTGAPRRGWHPTGSAPAPPRPRGCTTR